MVYFKDISTPSGVQHLVILDDEKQSEEKGTTLMAHTPLIGRYARQWPRLTNPLYTEQWSREVPLNKTSKVWSLQATNHRRSNEPIILPTLGRRIIEGKAKWGDTIQFAGEFRYIKGFWEWTEDILSRCEQKLVAAQVYDSVYASLFTYDRNSDVIKAFCEAWCPSTNTLLTSFGELSISLWDLHTLAGLPINGLLYDEVVPCAKELDGVDETGRRFVPRSCKFLLHAYHLLQRNNDGDQFPQVPANKWIKFWFKRATKYCEPPPRKEKKAVRPKSTHNPSGTFGVHGKWSSAEEALFSRLGIEGSLKEETFLAAYLACWLCTFALPTDGVGLIRPSTFKVASIMAAGRRVGLAVPILASVFKGLNEVSGSSRLIRAPSPFSIHFFYSWIAHYFKTHYEVLQGVRGPKMTLFSGEGGAKYYDPQEARKRIHKGDFVSWTCNMIAKDKDFSFVEDGRAKDFEEAYFMAIRSNYLPLRQGDHFDVEAYSPHRFTRQFRFFQ